MKQWEKDFDKLFVEQGSHRGGKVVREEASKIFDFIRETREQAYFKGFSDGKLDEKRMNENSKF